MFNCRFALPILCCYLLFATAVSADDLSRPNVVLIFIDDMGYADPSCFGNPLVKTPNIDKLAEEGIHLTNFYVNSPICSASRVALHTGQYQGRWKIHSFLNTRAGNANRGMADFLDPRAPTTARKFQQAGYATAHFGKWHMGGGRDVDDAPRPQEYGFDESLVSFEGLGDRIISNPRGLQRARELGHGQVSLCKPWERIQIQTDRTIDFIRRHQKQPFFVHLFPNDVHDRHDPLPGSAEQFKTVSQDPFERNFLAVLVELDRQIGRLMAEIEKLGLSEKTVVVFTSDNGPTDWPNKYRTGPPAGYTGGLRGRKWSLYDGGIRMPFIARWKGKIPANAVDDTSMMAAIDISPTLCSLAGISFEEQLDGFDRSSVLLGKPAPRAKPIFWQYGHPHAILKGGKPDHQSPTFAVRDEQWKLLMNPDGSEAQLFNLNDDRSERYNLLEQEPVIAARLAKLLSEWADDVGYQLDVTNMAAPGPTKAVLTSDQLLRFESSGVVGSRDNLKFDGQAWLSLPSFRAPLVAHGRNLQIKGVAVPTGSNGVILAHGDAQNGYALYLKNKQLCFSTRVAGKVASIQTELPARDRFEFEATWSPDGRMHLKVDKKPAGRAEGMVLQLEPSESMQIGADLGEPVGDYESPNLFSGQLKNLTFRYPNGT